MNKKFFFKYTSGKKSDLYGGERPKSHYEGSADDEMRYQQKINGFYIRTRRQKIKNISKIFRLKYGGGEFLYGGEISPPRTNFFANAG